MKKLNIAVIGTSGMAQTHMRGVNLCENANLYAICDIHQERLDACLKDFPAEKSCTDYRDLVNDPKVDAAIIVTPDYFHKEMTCAFLRAGKAVMCEKPMALKLEECEDMLRCEKETGGKLMIGQICRCTPGFKLAKEIVDAGRIGELYFVESEYAHNYDHARGVDDWRVTPERNGFIGGGCHAVDLVRWIAGDPIEVTALSNHKCLTDWPANDATIALYKFPNNVMGKVFASIGCHRNYTMRSVFYGTRGTIICDNTSPSIQLFTMDEPHEDGKIDYTKPHILPVDINNHNATLEVANFVDAVINDKPMPVSAMEGASTIAVAVYTVRSAEEGKTLTIKYPEI